MNKNLRRQVLIAVYSHPEYYPPTLNSIASLSELGFDATIICNNVYQSEWEYPDGTTILSLGEFMDIRSFEKISIVNKVYRWVLFTNELRKKLKKTALFIAYDPIPLFSFYVARLFIWKPLPLIWYHNHDIIEPNLVKKFSISWFAARLEKGSFPFIDVFSLPSLERKSFFSMNKLKGAFFFLPNYPRLSFFSQFRHIQKDKKCFKILYQGSIGGGHGIEEIIQVLSLYDNEVIFELVLKGFIHPEYKALLQFLADSKGISDRLKFVGITPYQDVPLTTAKCHIGIAIFTGQDTMNKTLGTASNKIFEYIACGLPVIYFDTEHYREHLGKYEWAIPTDLSPESLKKAIHHIATHFDELSQKAFESFEKELNFETYFSPLQDYLLNHKKLSITTTK